MEYHEKIRKTKKRELKNITQDKERKREENIISGKSKPQER